MDENLVVVIWIKNKKIGNIEMESSMFVSNHVSFIDIIVINSIMDIKFIAKSEIQKWPVIGRLAEKSGTIFIKKSDVGDNSIVIDKIKSYINNKKRVALFPEGRIGDGVTIRKFHSKLFNSSVIANRMFNLFIFYIRKNIQRISQVIYLYVGLIKNNLYQKYH